MDRNVASAWTVAVAVWRRELREARRDAHVLAFSVLFPVLLYPLLVWGVSGLLLHEAGHGDAPVRVEVRGADGADTLAAALGEAGAEVVAAEAGPVPARLEDAVDAVVEVHPEQGVTVHVVASEVGGRRARALVRRAVAQVTAQAVADWTGPPLPRVKRVAAASPGETSRALMSRVLPGMLLAAVWLGAIYPTVEVVVGERARGTLETTRVTTPHAQAVRVGKAAAVLTFVGVAGLGNLGAMGVTLGQLFAWLGRPLEGPWPGPGALVLGGLAVVGTALVATSVLVAVAGFARTVLEGQNLVALVATGGLLSGVWTVGPQVSEQLAWVPVANLAMVLRTVVAGNAVAPQVVVVTGVVTVLTCAVALRVAGMAERWHRRRT